MAGKDSPRKKIAQPKYNSTGGKLPANIKKLQVKPPSLASAESNRPRRFSLIYSSDSSLSDVSDVGNKKLNGDKANKAIKNPLLNKYKKGKGNTSGKNGKLIRESNGSNLDDENTESSDYQVFVSSDDDDDDDDIDDSDSETSSEDENIDFVKLNAQRKKRAMKALSAIKKTTALSKQSLNDQESKPASQDETDKVEEPLIKKDSVEDIGEEIKENNQQNIPIAPVNNGLDDFHVPTFSDSSESDYNIDQDAYFNVISDDDNDAIGDIDTGVETGEDDIPMLQQEEQNIVEELQNDDSLSFDGSIHEDGTDPEDWNNSKMKNEEDEDEYDDDFDLPFYEDPKFASLYYYADGNEPRLSLSTSLPLLLNDEKLTKLRKKQAKKMERQERIMKRKLLKDRRKVTNTTRPKTPSLDNGEEYMFGVFFHSDDEDEKIKEIRSDNARLTHRSDSETALKKNLDLESPLLHLEFAAKVKKEAISSNEENKNIHLNEAHLPSDVEDSDDSNTADITSNATKKKLTKLTKLTSIESDTYSDAISIELEDDDDNISLTNVFIDIDDLDPDSFYFQYDEGDDEFDDDDKYDDDSSSMYSDILTDDTDFHSIHGRKDDLVENVVYVDNESTDEDDNLPPPTSKSKSIATKAKEVVGSNVVGLRPPKLGTWETNSKPFSIIDGLSTKSLYPLIQEHQQLLEQRAQSQTPDIGTPDGSVTTNGDELTLNELLNMSELDDDEVNTPKNKILDASDWYEKPKVPLSAFRNKGVNSLDEDEYLLPANSTRKFPMGYVGNELTRRKIDRMKELQRKENEKRRKIKKKKKLLKLKREQERKEKTELTMGEINVSNIGINTSTALNIELNHKDSMKSVGLEEINKILGNDDSAILDINDHNILDDEDIDMDIEDSAIIDDNDVDILTSLTAPVHLDDFGTSGASLWRRRQSMVEAAEENMRFTKNGLFSETALADLEGIIEDGTSSNAFEFNEVLQ